MRRIRAPFVTVRGRAALTSTIVVAIALAVGGFGAVTALRTSLIDNLDETLLQQARDRAVLIEQGTDPASLTATLQEEALVWIGRPDGTTVAVGSVVVPLESPLRSGITELDGVREATILVEERQPDEPERESMTLRLATATTSAGDGDGGVLVVAVGAETETIANTTGQVAIVFLVAGTAVTLLVALLAWITVGRALRPVAAIRRQTVEISGASLAERVPVPAARDEVHELAVTMNEMLDRLERHDVATRRFTADASHELKSPVANVRALVETSSIDDPAWPTLRQRLAQEADRLRDLVDNLLYLASSDESGRAGSDRTSRVDVDELVFAEAELIAATGRVRVDLGEVEPTTTQGDERALSRMLRNLADNAARHAEGIVEFTVRDGGDRVTIEVSDDGPGIPAERRDEVFERFTRLDDARARDAGGAGLGLSIVRRIVADHDGSITIVDRDGGGTTFRVELSQRSS